MSLQLVAVQQSASAYLDKIKAMFKPGVKVTLLVRTPDHPERDFVMTDDDLLAVSAAVLRRAASVAAQADEAGKGGIK